MLWSYLPFESVLLCLSYSSSSISDVDIPNARSLRHANELVNELSSLKKQMKGLLSDTEDWKTDIGSIKQTKNIIRQEGPAPLDQYLVKAPSSGSTPFPAAKTLSPRHFNAPIAASFSEAEDILRQVKSSKSVLEANLQNVIRSQNDAEVYALIGNLMEDSNSSDRRIHIRKLVDDCIKIVEEDVHREVAEDFAKEAEKKASTLQGQGKVPVKGHPMKFPTRGQDRYQTGSKVDIGMQRGKRVVDTAKENIPGRLKPGTKKPKVSTRPQDADYISRVYGKSIYQNQRTTVRNPYLHFKNDPKQKPIQPVPVVETKGTEIKSSKTQTSISEEAHPIQQKYYFTPNPVLESGASAPVHGDLIPMAVPLGGPRMNSGITIPVTMTMSAAITTSPKAQPKLTPATNVAMVTIGHDVCKAKRKTAPNLAKQDLPQVDINSVPNTPTDHMHSTPVRDGENDFVDESYIQQEAFVVTKETENLSQDESSQVESSVDEIPDPAFALPGYRPYVGQYNGPAFPPKIPSLPGPSSDVIAEDLRRQNDIQSQAVDWIEQELLARIVSELQPSLPQQPSHLVTEQSEDSYEEKESMQVVDAIGQDGLQLFINAGRPVDPELVNALVREVLMEKITTMMGQKPEDEGQPIATEGATNLAADNSEKPTPMMRRVVTPEPTPKSSPVSSPRRVPSPPTTPPISPLGSPADIPKLFEAKIEAELPQKPIEPSADTEPETSTSVDISEELRVIAAKIAGPDETTDDVESIHDIGTPSVTPPATPRDDSVPSTPPLSPRVFIKEATTPIIQAEIPRIPERSASPRSPLPEENPNYDEEAYRAMANKPRMISVTTQAELEDAAEPLSEQPPTPRSATPPPEKSLDTETSLEGSSYTDTYNDPFSEGQWLVDRSEGQIADYVIDPVTRQKMLQASRMRSDMSLTSTLQDTEDLEQELAEDASEGEFLVKAAQVRAAENDPLLELLSQVQQPMGYQQYDIPANHVQDLLNGTSKSMGEISLYQSPTKPVSPTVIEVRQSTDNVSETKDSPLKMVDLRSSGGVRTPDGKLPAQRMVTVSAGGRTSPSRHPVRRTVPPRSPSPQDRMDPQQRIRSVQVRSSTDDLHDTLESHPDFIGTYSDLATGTMTPDQMNVDALIQSGYLTHTMSHSEDLPLGRVLEGSVQHGFDTLETTNELADFNQSKPWSVNRSDDFSQSRQQSLRRSNQSGLSVSFDNSATGTMNESELQRLAGSGTKLPMKMSVTIPTIDGSDDDETEDLSEISIGDGH